MHYLPDTNDEEALQERFWPDGYKVTLRREVRNALSRAFPEADMKRVYRRAYLHSRSSLKEFTECLVNGIVIGAENGADEGFESVYASFLAECELPEIYPYPDAFYPPVFNGSNVRPISRAIMADFRDDDGFRYAYKDGYTCSYAGYDKFLAAVADIMLAGIKKGVYSVLQRYYEAFVHGYPLPPMRRNPRRVKTW